MLFADHFSLIANKHNYKDTSVPIMNQGCVKESIVIGGVQAKAISRFSESENKWIKCRKGV